MATAEYDDVATEGPRTGLISPRQQVTSTALVAAQQRARSEIEAALTVAAARPRDEAESLDKILTSCQRIGVAAEAEFSFSRGGSEIRGASIRLLEVCAQHWGHIDFGFEELSRTPPQNGQPGESVVKAFAWDMQTNVRRTYTFTVRHMRDKKGGAVPLKDERDIYEKIANDAQRRVRTALENVIPRDIVDSAREECHKTLHATEQVTEEKLQKLLEAFKAFGVTKEMIEERIQRKGISVENVQPAMLIRLRTIYVSLRDGMGEVSDFFTVATTEAPRSAVDTAKEAMRAKNAKPAPQPAAKPAAESQDSSEDDANQDTGNDDASQVPPADVWAELNKALEATANKAQVAPVEKEFLAKFDTEDDKANVSYSCELRRKYFEDHRSGKKSDKLFDTQQGTGQ